MAQFEIKKIPTRVAICGTGSGWELLPQNTNSVLYCLNDFVRIDKYQVKPDLLFIMDILDEKPQVVSGQDNLGEIISVINRMRVPLICPFRYEEIPLSVPFPIDDCVKRFGIPYFTNTICYMIAYALLAGAKEIEMYGVNQAGSHEYAEEKGGVEYWLGIASGMGVQVSINGKDSQLLRYKGRYGNDQMYGYLQSYEQIKDARVKYGEPVIRRLLQPKQRKTRLVRNVNHDNKGII